MLWRGFSLVLAAGIVALTGAAAAGADGSTTATIGTTTLAPPYFSNHVCAGGTGAIEVEKNGSSLYTVPSGSWTLTSWSTRAFGTAQAALVVLRPTGGDGYKVVGATATETVSGSGLKTFTASATVQGGELIALWWSGGLICDFTGPTSPTDAVGRLTTAKPTSGQTLSIATLGGPTFQHELDLAATLTRVEKPDEGGHGPAGPPREPDHTFLCYSTFQVDPGTWATDEAPALLAQGYWLPYAEKSSQTATSIGGGYYLDCQQFKPTGHLVNQDGVDLGEDAQLAKTPGYYPEGT